MQLPVPGQCCPVDPDNSQIGTNEGKIPAVRLKKKIKLIVYLIFF